MNKQVECWKIDIKMSFYIVFTSTIGIRYIVQSLICFWNFFVSNCFFYKTTRSSWPVFNRKNNLHRIIGMEYYYYFILFVHSRNEGCDLDFFGGFFHNLDFFYILRRVILLKPWNKTKTYFKFQHYLTTYDFQI